MIQLEGPITLGGNDYSDEISSFVINDTRNTVTVPGTFGDATEVDRAGAHKWSATITFHSDLAAASVWAELLDAMLTDTAELGFTARFKSGPVSGDNQEVSGTLLVTALDTGGTVNELRQQTQTYPMVGAPTFSPTSSS